MLELGERVRLGRETARHLQRDQPGGEVALARQVHAPERPAAQLFEQVEADEIGAHVRERRRRLVPL